MALTPRENFESVETPEVMGEALSTGNDNERLQGEIGQVEGLEQKATNDFLDKHGQASGLLGNRSLDLVEGRTGKATGTGGAVEHSSVYRGSGGNSIEETGGATALALAKDMQEAYEQDQNLKEEAGEIVAGLNRQQAEDQIAEIPEVQAAQGQMNSEIDLAQNEHQQTVESLQPAANDWLASVGIETEDEAA